MNARIAQASLRLRIQATAEKVIPPRTGTAESPAARKHAFILLSLAEPRFGARVGVRLKWSRSMTLTNPMR
jgi:hypothetical protein